MAKDGHGKKLQIGQLVRVKVNPGGEQKTGRVIYVEEEFSRFVSDREAVTYQRPNKDFVILE